MGSGLLITSQEPDTMMTKLVFIWKQFPNAWGKKPNSIRKNYTWNEKMSIDLCRFVSSVLSGVLVSTVFTSRSIQQSWRVSRGGQGWSVMGWKPRIRNIKGLFHLCAQKYPAAKRPLKIQHSHTFLVDIIKKLSVYALSVWQLGYIYSGISQVTLEVNVRAAESRLRFRWSQELDKVTEEKSSEDFINRTHHLALEDPELQTFRNLQDTWLLLFYTFFWCFSLYIYYLLPLDMGYWVRWTFGLTRYSCSFGLYTFSGMLREFFSSSLELLATERPALHKRCTCSLVSA